MICWHEIDTVLLDMDGTLLDLHFDNHFWQEHLPSRYAQQHHLSLSEAKAHLERRFSAEKGSLNWYSTAFWSDALAVDIPALKEEVADRIRLRPAVKPFLRRLDELGKRVVLLTNAHRQSIEIKLRITQLERQLHQIHSTHDLGLAKEQPGFWEKFAQKEPFDPSRTLLIDDTLEVLQNAQRHGIRHLLAIHQPDSKAPPRPATEFVALESFTQITP